MKTEQYDVVIVGGGPAGSNAARMIREYSDKSVIVFERAEEPAANCAGGLGIPFEMHMGIKPPEHIVESPIRNVVLASPNEEMELKLEDVDASGVEWVDDELDEMGWVVDRQAWDNHQLDLADEGGADVRTKHTVKQIDQTQDGVELRVHDRVENEEFKVKSEYAGLANGPSWELAVEAGFEEAIVVPPEKEKHIGRQFHMKDPDYFQQYGYDTIYLEFNRDYAPEGYVWSFPEGKKYTRWGNGVPLSRSENASECMKQYLKDNGKWEYAEEDTRENTMAVIPTAEPLNTAVNGNVGLIGDVAHHCDPLHGGGLMFSCRASKQFARSTVDDDLGKYDKLWKDDFLDTLQHRFIIRDLLYSMDNDDYDRFIAAIKGFNVQGLNPDEEIPRLMWHCLKNDKGIFTKSALESTKSLAKRRLM
jgi:digeranylgeranylglycerophospholipid reductase